MALLSFQIIAAEIMSREYIRQVAALASFMTSTGIMEGAETPLACIP